MSTERNDGGQAFPFTGWRSPDGMVIDNRQYGMSLRDWFAGQIMAAAMTNAENIQLVDDETLLGAAKEAYRVADAMVKAREA